MLEHVKEYGKEDEALRELKRVTRPGGVVVVGTPNTELTGDHGFDFDEIAALFERYFDRFVIFENALVPTGEAEKSWTARREQGRTGVIVTQRIDLAEAYVSDAGSVRLKEGIPAGTWHLDDVVIDTTLLHNTHSWVVVAMTEAKPRP